MEHEAKVVKEETLSGDRATYHIRCCDDPKSEMRHTYDPTRVSATDLAAAKQMHIARSAKEHAAKVPVVLEPAPVTFMGMGRDLRKH
jgi:hypothetical protein